MRKLPALLVLIAGLGVDGAVAAEPCAIKIEIDRVYRNFRYPSALVTLKHNCGGAFASVRVACTWLMKDKPVAAGDGIVSNLQPGIPASSDVFSVTGRGIAFDSARCRVENTRK